MAGVDDSNEPPASVSVGPLFGGNSVSPPVPSFPTCFSTGGSFTEGPVSVTGPIFPCADAAIDVSEISEAGEAFFERARLVLPEGPVSASGSISCGSPNLDSASSGPLSVPGPDLGEPYMCTAGAPWAPGVDARLVLHPDARVWANVRFCPHCGFKWELE